MSNSKAEIKKLEEKLLSNEVRNSEEELNRLLADDFLEYGKSGSVYTRKNVIEALLQEENKIIITLFDFEVKLLAENVMLALYKTKTSNNKVVLRSSIWKKHITLGWQIVFHQGTLNRDEGSEQILKYL